MSVKLFLILLITEDVLQVKPLPEILNTTSTLFWIRLNDQITMVQDRLN